MVAESASAANPDKRVVERSEGDRDLVIDFERRSVGFRRVKQDYHETCALSVDVDLN